MVLFDTLNRSKKKEARKIRENGKRGREEEKIKTNDAQFFIHPKHKGHRLVRRQRVTREVFVVERRYQ